MSDAAIIDLFEEEPEERPEVDRDADLLGRRRPSPLREHLDELFNSIKRGFEAQNHRSNKIEDYWDCYNCESNGNRYYNGIAEIYLPMIHDAVEARVTRFTNQLFPQGGRYVQAITADGSTENDLVALLDHYIRSASFKTLVAEPLVRNGDVEGQYNLYVDWCEIDRQIVQRSARSPTDPMTGAPVPGAEIEDIEEEDVREGRPVFEVLHDPDVLVLPATADSVEEALQCGGSVTIVRRWSKEKIDRMAKDGNIRKDEARLLKEEMSNFDPDVPDIERHLLEHVQIRKDGKEATVWESWHMAPLNDKGKFSEDGRPRLCRIFFGPQQCALGMKRNPYWNDRCPLLSEPVKKMSGVFKGGSLVRYVETLQYEANDAVNEGADAATLSAAPVIARDPEKYNGPLVYNIGAVWDIPPGSVELLQFPDLTPRAMTRVGMAQQQVFQTMTVNPSMLPQQTGSPNNKRNQAEIAMEQSVDLLTTEMGVAVLGGMLSDVAEWIVDLDYQFRDEAVQIRAFGEMGKAAAMQEVAPLQNRAGFSFQWRGAEQARMNAMLMQQGMGWLNVLRGMRQDLMAEGMQLKLGPIIEAGTANLFGPLLASQILADQRAQLSIPQDEENAWLLDGFAAPVNPMDDDAEHLARLQPAIQETGDPHGTLRVHAQQHMAQRAAKAQAQMMQAMQQMMQGQQGPLGPGGPPGMSRGGAPPRQGAMPESPRMVAGPPGMIPQDSMPRAGAIPFPRKT